MVLISSNLFLDLFDEPHKIFPGMDDLISFAAVYGIFAALHPVLQLFRRVGAGTAGR